MWSARLVPAFRQRVDFGRDGEVQGRQGLLNMDVVGGVAMEDEGQNWQPSNSATTESLCLSVLQWHSRGVAGCSIEWGYKGAREKGKRLTMLALAASESCLGVQPGMAS